MSLPAAPMTLGILMMRRMRISSGSQHLHLCHQARTLHLPRKRYFTRDLMPEHWHSCPEFLIKSKYSDAFSLLSSSSSSSEMRLMMATLGYSTEWQLHRQKLKTFTLFRRETPSASMSTARLLGLPVTLNSAHPQVCGSNSSAIHIALRATEQLIGWFTMMLITDIEI